MTIPAVTAATNAGDSGFQTGFFGDFESDSSTSVTDAGGSTPDAVLASVTAGTRYAQYVWADNASGSTTHTATSDYQVSMVITPDNPGTVYQVQIDTIRLGALTLVDDSFFSSCCFSSAEIGAATGSVGGILDSNLALPGLLSNESPDNQEINQSSTTTITGLTGVLNLILDFTWTAEAFSNNDEGAVRLGMESPTAGVDADNYPGPDGRVMASDGHFVTVEATVTVVPEPSTALLLGLGLAGLLAGRRNRA